MGSQMKAWLQLEEVGHVISAEGMIRSVFQEIITNNFQLIGLNKNKVVQNSCIIINNFLAGIQQR
jgi:hypothetical protein